MPHRDLEGVPKRSLWRSHPHLVRMQPDDHAAVVQTVRQILFEIHDVPTDLQHPAAIRPSHMRRKEVHGQSADKRSDGRRDGGVEHVEGRSDLGDPTVDEDHQAICDRQCVLLFVGRKERGDAELTLKPHQLIAKTVPDLGVRLCQRLVEKQ